MIMAANGGLLTRSQALDAGLSPSDDPAPAATPARWCWLRRGVYADGELWDRLDEYRGQPELRTRAALVTMRRAYVVSHDSAGHEHELDLLLPPEPHVHITRPGFTAAWTEYGVKHHLARFREDQVVQLNGLRVLDIASHGGRHRSRARPTPYGEVACDSAMRSGVTRPPWRPRWSRCVAGRTSTAHGPPSTSPTPAPPASPRRSAETWSELMAAGHCAARAPVPGAASDGRVAGCDILLGCHDFERDGQVKYVPVEEGGLADKPAHEVVWAEKKRERELHRLRTRHFADLLGGLLAAAARRGAAADARRVRRDRGAVRRRCCRSTWCGTRGSCGPVARAAQRRVTRSSLR